MTETTINVSPAFIKAAEIRLAKRDYGGIAEYFPFGNKSFVQMIHVKTKRLVNLTKSHAKPQNESIEDNLIDLINYASYYYEWMKGELNE